MTTLLKKAFDATSHLNNEEQDSIAQIIIDELEDEKKWTASFKQTSDKLELLAKEAISDYQSKKTKPYPLQ